MWFTSKPEMSATINILLQRRTQRRFGVSSPIYLPGPVEPLLRTIVQELNRLSLISRPNALNADFNYKFRKIFWGQFLHTSVPGM